MATRSSEEFSSFFTATLGLKELKPDDAMGSTRGWSSLAHVDLILALEDWAGVSIPPELIGELTSVTSIVAYLSENRVLDS